MDAAAMAALPRSFFARPSTVVAPDLLGRRILHATPEGLVGATIVETEAYGGPEDLASHARAGRTRRTRTMFGPPGIAYVYLVYGMHWCFNVVTESDGVAGAVLVRAAVPVVGADLQVRFRGRPHEPAFRLAAGPARLCRALAIDGACNDVDLTEGAPLWIATGDPADTHARVVRGPRIGVDYAGERWASVAYRYGVAAHPALSRPFPA